MFCPISVVEIGISITILPTGALRCREIVTFPAVCKKVTDSSSCLHSCLFSAEWRLCFINQMPDYTLCCIFQQMVRWEDRVLATGTLRDNPEMESHGSQDKTPPCHVSLSTSIPGTWSQFSDEWWPQCPHISVRCKPRAQRVLKQAGWGLGWGAWVRKLSMGGELHTPA